jgi:hypothetical protein
MTVCDKEEYLAKILMKVHFKKLGFSVVLGFALRALYLLGRYT